VGRHIPAPPKPKNTTTQKAPQQISALPIPVPDPTKPGLDGFLEMLRLAFHPDEYVALAQNVPQDDGTMAPNSGVIKKRKDWEAAIAEGKGQLWRVLQTTDGLFIRVNPMQKGGKTNDEVADFRHVLVEFDKDKAGSIIPKEVQFGMLSRSGLPITTITDSANKSLHAWIRVDAVDKTEYKQRAEQIYALFPDMGLDEACKNPSRLSRCPGGKREMAGGDIRIQHLVATNIGPKTWKAYEAAQKVQMIGDALTIKELLAFDTKNDETSVLGARWLCKGSSVMFVSQSGVGKSSLMMQLSISWAINAPWGSFGIAAKRPLKILLIQAENDRGDMAEQVQGVVAAMGLTDDDKNLLNENLIIYRDATHSGHEFLDVLESLIRLNKPDLVWIDPLLNYIGDDISDQSVCSAYTGRLSQIGNETGAIIALIHHTGKPKKDGTFTSSDLAYMGLGSSVLTAWAREVVALIRQPSSDPRPVFELVMTKRRHRAEARDINLKIADRIYIRHAAANDGICWETCAKPEEPEEKKKKPFIKYTAKRSAA